MTKDQCETMIQGWNAFKTDKERWEFFLKNKDKLMLMLDNDSTFVIFKDTIFNPLCAAQYMDEEDLFFDEQFKPFEDWIGNSPGLDILLPLIGIQAEGV